MARGHVWLTPSGGTPQKYRVLDWKVGQRPSQAADPSALVVAEWRIDGPMGTSYEDITDGGFGHLGIDYTTNCDARWNNVLCLGPLANSVTLTGEDITWTAGVYDSTSYDAAFYDASPTSGTIVGFALMEGGGTMYLYVARGRYVTKVDLADLTVKETHVLPENAVSIVASVTATGVREITVGMRNHAAEVMTSVATPPSTDTWVVNAENVAAAVIASGGDRMVWVGKNASGTANVVAGNILSGVVTQANPAIQDIATLPGSVTVTGFGTDGPFYVVMTDEGPFMLDEEKREFFALIDEIPRSMENRVVGKWFALGTLLGLATGARFSRFGSGESYGLEKFPQNTSPVQGFMTGQTASARWSYEAWYNPVEADTTIIAWRDRAPRDGHGNSVLSPFPIISVPNARVNAILNVDDASGKRTNPTLVYGEGADTLRYVTMGRNAREIDDSNYRFTASGTAYLTEMKRWPGMTKQLQAVEFETDNCDANKTVTFGVVVDGAHEVTAAIAASADDAREFSDGFMSTSGVTLSADETTEWIGLRFQGLAIPQGATILSAHLTVTPVTADDDEPNHTIYADDTDNAPAFSSSANDISSRSRTAATVTWASADLGADGSTSFDTPDLKTVVQEVVDRAGWAAGNAMAFLIQGSADPARDLGIIAYDDNPPYAARLFVRYEGPTALTPVTTNGWQRLLFVDGSGVPLTTTTGKNIKPQIAIATNSSSTSPLVKGPLRLHMRVRPILAEYIDATLLLERRADVTPESLQDELFSIDEGSTVLVGEDDDRDRYFVDVEVVETSWLDTQKTRGEDRANDAPRVAKMRMVKWPVASGD